MERVSLTPPVLQDQTNVNPHLWHKSLQLILEMKRLLWVMAVWALITLKKSSGKLYKVGARKSITDWEIWKWCLAGEDSYHPSIHVELNKTYLLFSIGHSNDWNKKEVIQI